MTPGKDGLWLRKQFLILARNNHTDVSFWASQPLTALQSWILTNNDVVEAGKKKDQQQN